jgi:hypothetical protein
MSFQKESQARGKVIEQWQDTLRQEVSGLVEGMTLSNQREKGKITPTSGAIKEYRAEPGSLTKACYAAAAYAKRDSKEYVVVPGNSMMQKVYHITPQSDGLSKFGILSGTTVQVMLVKPDGSIFQCDAVGAALKKESTLGEGWEQPFRDSLNEQDDWDAREHPRDRSTGEFVGTARATAHQFRAAHQAHKDRKKEAGKTAKGPIPTTREPVKPSRSKYDPQPAKAEKPPAPSPEEPKKAPEEPQQQVTPEKPSDAVPTPQEKPAEEPKKEPEAPPAEPEAQPPAPEQPQAAQQPPPEAAPPASGYTPMPGAPMPVPVLDPMTGLPMMDPMTGQPVMQFVNPLVPGAPEPRLPNVPKQGKQLPQDNPYKPKEGEAPKLPAPPTSEPVKQPRLGEPLKVTPPVPSAPPRSNYSRRNRDLDAAFGFTAPEGEQQPPAAAPGADKTREADAAQEVKADPELGPLAQELGVADDPDSDPDVQAFSKAVGEAPQTGNPQDTEAYLKQREKELSTYLGRIARKTYAKDLKKAKQWIDSLPAGDPNAPKDAKERLDLIRAKAKELQEERAENFKRMLAGGAWLATMAGGVAADALDKIIHASTEVYQDLGNPYAQM